ncbi:unnamed protein product, partial [Closterium sp. NIES-64]
ALSLPPDMLAHRTVETLDIAEGGSEEGKTGREREGLRADGRCVDGAQLAFNDSLQGAQLAPVDSIQAGHSGRALLVLSQLNPPRPGGAPSRTSLQAHSAPLMTAQGGHSGRALPVLNQLTKPPTLRSLSPLPQAHSAPLMIAYKVVTVDVPCWGFGSRLEKYLAKVLQRRLSLETNQAVVCWMDEWIGLSEQQVRAMEEHTFSRINQVREACETLECV